MEIWSPTKKVFMAVWGVVTLAALVLVFQDGPLYYVAILLSIMLAFVYSAGSERGWFD